jgi:PadR family transcriptional regulator PadR
MTDDEKWMAQIRRGALELCILAILARGKRYGYDIAHALSGAEGPEIKEGTIYPLLNRLRIEGLIDAEWQLSPQGPQRKYYTLTATGAQRLAAMRAEWRRFAADVDRLIEGVDEA